MSGLKSLALAIEVAQRRRDQAEQTLRQIQRAALYARGQLDQLQSYAADSEARWATAAAATVRAELMLHHRQFMDRLRQAIEMQQDAMANLERQVDEARQRCVQEEVRLAALEQLRQKRLQLRARAEARREQKQMDELSMLQHQRNAVGRRLGE